MSSATLADKYITRDGAAVADAGGHPKRHQEGALQEIAPAEEVWTPAMQAEFRTRQRATGGPVGVAVAISYTAVSGREHDPRTGRVVYEWGGAEGVRLARLWVSKTAPWESWRIDAMHRHSIVPIQMAGRLWTTDPAQVYRLEEWADCVLRAWAVEPDRGCWLPLARDVDAAAMMAAIKDMARTGGVQVVETDAELAATIRMAVEVR